MIIDPHQSNLTPLDTTAESTRSANTTPATRTTGSFDGKDIQQVDSAVSDRSFHSVSSPVLAGGFTNIIAPSSRVIPSVKDKVRAPLTLSLQLPEKEKSLFQSVLSTPNSLELDELQSEIQALNDRTHYEEVSLSAITAETLSNGSPQKIEDPSQLTSFLKKQGIIKGTRLGEGGFSSVYEATVHKNTSAYVWKEDQYPSRLANYFGRKFWRGEIAASRLALKKTTEGKPALPHFAKSLCFLLEIEKPNEPSELWYIPTNHVKNFGLSLPDKTDVIIKGQLMERAEGKELFELYIDEENPWNGEKYFNSFARQLCEFLEGGAARNFIHRDLKAENTMCSILDPVKGEIKATFVDPGSAEQLPKPEKLEQAKQAQAQVVQTSKKDLRTKTGNIFMSKKYQGTLGWMAPQVVLGKSYESEIDYFSGATLLLEFLSPFEVRSCIKAHRSNPNNFGFMPLNHTDIYETILGKESNLSKIFERNPSAEKIINLMFAVSKTTNWTDRKAAIDAVRKEVNSLAS